MKKNILFVIVFIIVTFIFFLGCGYTILRDFKEEAKQAELAAIDSLLFAPDLTITNIDYKYIPPPSRGPLDRAQRSAEVQFRVTIANIGNSDFCNPYLVAFTQPNEQEYGKPKFYALRFNENKDTIRSNSEQVIELPNFGPIYGSTRTFVIVTNPKIQHELYRVDDYFTPGPYHPPTIPVTREFRYDNNNYEFTIPRRVE